MFSQKELGGISIVAGTAIGASMLALPFATGIAGFWTAVLALVSCYGFGLLTLFLFLEVTLYCEDPKANIISMAQMHLGMFGEVITWIFYLLLLYTISTAYVVGAGQLLNNVTDKLDLGLSFSTCSILFTLIFGYVAFQGVHILDKLNQFLLASLFMSYLGLIINIGPMISLSKLSGGDPSLIFKSLPTTIAAFCCHFVVPSLRKNFSDDLPCLKKMLFVGATIPLLTYIIYEFLIISVLPFDGEMGLLAISRSGNQLGMLLKALSTGDNTIFPLLMNIFQNCAILTSFLGVVLALSDFLQDGLNLKGNPYQKHITALLTLAPPLVAALLIPANSPGFVLALDLSGLIVTFLFGILPVIMVWRARYVEKMQSAYVLPGGKAMLVFIALLCTGVMYNVATSTFQ